MLMNKKEVIVIVSRTNDKRLKISKELGVKYWINHNLVHGKSINILWTANSIANVRTDNKLDVISEYF